MNRLTTFIIACACVLVAHVQARADGDAPFVPRQAVVRLHPGQPIAPVLARHGLSVIASIPERHTYLLQLPATPEESQIVSDLASDARVIHADLHYLAEDTDPGGTTQDIFLARTVNDYLAHPITTDLRLSNAHQVSRGAGIVVAVIDSGIDPTHPRLAANIAPGSFDFLTDLPGAPDTGTGEFVGHGTMVAGLVLRVAPDATILPLRVMDPQGQATSFRLARAIYRAIDNNARVINISMGSIGEPMAVLDAVTEASARGIIVVAAAGNDNTGSDPRFPAAFQAAGVIGVAATSRTGVRAPFSNFGESCTIAAPGLDLVSTMLGGGYAQASGTSFAAPLVSGTLALLLSHCPTLPAAQAQSMLLSTSTSIDAINPNYQDKLGAGMISPAALTAAADSGPSACACAADFDRSGQVALTDLFIFLNAWFADCAPATFAAPCHGRSADTNRSGTRGVDDIFTFLSLWFAGC